MDHHQWPRASWPRMKPVSISRQIRQWTFWSSMDPFRFPRQWSGFFLLIAEILIIWFIDHLSFPHIEPVLCLFVSSPVPHDRSGHYLPIGQMSILWIGGGRGVTHALFYYALQIDSGHHHHRSVASSRQSADLVYPRPAQSCRLRDACHPPERCHLIL